MIEFHGRLSAGAAIAMIRRLEPFDPAWCEEPVAPECLELLAEVKRSVRAPIAAGERLYTLADFYRLTALRAADVVQMDLAHCGGISAGKKIAAMAAVQDLRVAPHCSIGPVALAACLHFDVSTPNFMIQEAFAEFDVPWRNDLVGGWNPIRRRRVRRCPTRPAWASSSTKPRSPSILMSPTRFPACGTATGRRTSPRTSDRGPFAVTRLPHRAHGRFPRRGGRRRLWRHRPGSRLEASRMFAGTSSTTWPRARTTGLLVAALFAGSHARAHPGRRRPGRAAALGQAEHVRRGGRRPGRHRPFGRGLRQDRPGGLHRARRGRVQCPAGPEPLDGFVGPAVHAGAGQAAARAGADHAAGRWDLQAAVMGSEIGRTLGIVGLGHSGRELVRLVAPFEMRVLAYSPHADAERGRSARACG